MALQVWLSLSEPTLVNHGVANVTITNSGATYYANDFSWYFNGSSRIQISLPTTMTTIKNTTVAAWIKSTSSTLALGGISHNSTPNYYDCSCTLYSSGWQTGDLTNSTWRYISSGSVANTGVWHHVACTISDTNVTTYLDGIQVAQKTLADWGMTSFELNTTQHFIEIGSDYPGGDEFLTGYIKDFRIYDECLDAKLIYKLADKLGEGLAIWLPLTKDLRQQGLSSVTVINHGATFNTEGKLGGCYYFNRSTPTYLTLDNPFKKIINGMSLAFWVKLPQNGAVNDQLVHIGNGSGWGNNRFNCFVRAGTSQIVCVCGDGNNSTQYNQISSSLPLNEWVHVAYTYDNGNVKIYLNGNLDKTYTSSIIPSFANVPSIGIGCGPNQTEPATAYMNDVRIYTKSLSEMEVKEIAKGLVLHYPLADAYVEATTNLATINGPGGWNNSGESTRATNDSFYTNPPCSDCPVYSIKQTAAGNSAITFSSVNATNANIKGQQVSCSVWVYLKNTQGSQVVYLRSTVNDNKTGNSIANLAYNGSTDPRTWPLNKWIRITGTGTVDSNETSVYFCTYTGLLNEERAFNGWQIELKDHVTPYVKPQTSRRTGVVYDTSGYCHNGTVVGTLETSSDTPKYGVSTIFTAEPNAISSVTNFSHLTTFTYNCWIKTNTAHNAFVLMGYQYGNNTSGSLALDSGTSKAGFHYYAHAGGQGDVTIGSNVNYYDNQWHMLTATYDGSKIITYFDGVKTAEGSVSLLTSSRTFSLNQPSGASGRYFKGQMSDARVYATALSADDVKSLYQNEAYIDSSGNIYGKIRN